MPMLFAGQHEALVQAQARLFGDEKLCAFLDDMHITSLPGKATEAHTIVEEELNSGPTQASTSTMAKPKCEIVVVWSPKTLRN